MDIKSYLELNFRRFFFFCLFNLFLWVVSSSVFAYSPCYGPGLGVDGEPCILPSAAKTNQITLTTPNGVTTVSDTAVAIASFLCMKNSACEGKYFGVLAKFGQIEDMIYFKITENGDGVDKGIMAFYDRQDTQYGGYVLRFGGSAGGTAIRPSNTCVWSCTHLYGLGACASGPSCYNATHSDTGTFGYRVNGYQESQLFYAGGDCCPGANAAGMCQYNSWCSSLIPTFPSVELAPTFIMYSTNTANLLRVAYHSDDVDKIKSGDFGVFNGSTHTYSTDSMNEDVNGYYQDYLNNGGVVLSYSDVADTAQGISSAESTLPAESVEVSVSSVVVNVDVSSVTSAINSLHDSFNDFQSFMSSGPSTTSGDIQSAFGDFQVALSSVPLVALFERLIPVGSSVTWTPCFDFDFSGTVWAKPPFQFCMDTISGWSTFMAILRWSLLMVVFIWGIRYIWGGY